MEIVIKKPTIPGAEKPGCEHPPAYRGKPGPQGPAGTIEIAQVVTIEPSDPARVENIGDSTNAKLILYIPKGDPGNKGEPGAALEITEDIIQSIINALNLTPESVGLGNVDNTSDMDKPVSKAQEEALMSLAIEIGDHVADTNNPHGVTREQIGLGNVDDTSDMDKPVSIAQAEAMAMVAMAINNHIANGENPHGVSSQQTGAAPAVADSNYPGCYYRLVNTVVGEIREWINPPMVLGVEYRTTERHNGAVVYAVRLTVGELLNKGTTTTTLPSIPAEIVEIYGTAKSDAYTETVTFPILTASGAVGARLIKTGTQQIAAKTFADYSGYVATATVRYTKAKEPNA